VQGGPSQDDKVIASLTKATTVDLIAKDTADGYWLIKYPPTGIFAGYKRRMQRRWKL